MSTKEQSWALRSIFFLQGSVRVCCHGAMSTLECSWVLMSADKCSQALTSAHRESATCSIVLMSTEECSLVLLVLMIAHEQPSTLMIMAPWTHISTIKRSWALFNAHKHYWAWGRCTVSTRQHLWTFFSTHEDSWALKSAHSTMATYSQLILRVQKCSWVLKTAPKCSWLLRRWIIKHTKC